MPLPNPLKPLTILPITSASETFKAITKPKTPKIDKIIYVPVKSTKLAHPQAKKAPIIPPPVWLKFT